MGRPYMSLLFLLFLVLVRYFTLPLASVLFQLMAYFSVITIF